MRSRRSRLARLADLCRLTPIEWGVVALVAVLLVGGGWPRYARWVDQRQARAELEGIARIRSGIVRWSSLHSDPGDTSYPSGLDTCPPVDPVCPPFGAVLSELPPGGWRKLGPHRYQGRRGRTFDYCPQTGSWTEPEHMTRHQGTQTNQAP